MLHFIGTGARRLLQTAVRTDRWKKQTRTEIFSAQTPEDLYATYKRKDFFLEEDTRDAALGKFARIIDAGISRAGFASALGLYQWLTDTCKERRSDDPLRILLQRYVPPAANKALCASQTVQQFIEAWQLCKTWVEHKAKTEARNRWAELSRAEVDAANTMQMVSEAKARTPVAHGLLMEGPYNRESDPFEIAATKLHDMCAAYIAERRQIGTYDHQTARGELRDIVPYAKEAGMNPLLQDLILQLEHGQLPPAHTSAA